MSRTHEKFFESFLNFETENNLFDLKVKNKNIWDHLRYKVFCNALNSTIRGNQIKGYSDFKNPITLRDINNSIYLLISFIKFICFLLKKRSYDFIIIDDGSRKYNNQESINPKFYHLIQHLKDSNRILILNTSKDNRLSGNIDSCTFLNISFLQYLGKITSFFLYFSHNDNKVFEEISLIIHQCLDFKISPKTLKKDFIERSYVQYKFFRILMSRLKIKAVLLCDNGSYKGLYEAARYNNIDSVDFQHSLMSKFNILYTYKDTIKKESIVAPTKIFTFGEYWTKEYSIPTKIVPVGFPFFESKKKELLDKAVEEIIPGYIKENTFLIISSMHSGLLLAKTVIDLANQLPEYRFIYKLRKDEYKIWKYSYPKEFQENKQIIVIDTDEIDLYQLYRISNYQIGINSTAILEGIPFHLTTFIIKDGWYKEMQSLVDFGYATFVQTAYEIIKNMNNSDFMNSDFNSFFKKHSLVNIEKELK